MVVDCRYSPNASFGAAKAAPAKTICTPLIIYISVSIIIIHTKKAKRNLRALEWLAMPCVEWLPALGIQG